MNETELEDENSVDSLVCSEASQESVCKERERKEKRKLDILRCIFILDSTPFSI